MSGHRCCLERDTLPGQEHSELSQDLCTDAFFMAFAELGRRGVGQSPVALPTSS